MKKLIGLVLLAGIILSLAACAGNEKAANIGIEKSGFSKKNAEEMDMEKLNIVCANFPEYDWVSNIIKGSDKADVWLLVDDGTDIHSFQPGVEDMVKVNNCNMFVYAGGEGAGWVKDLLANVENEQMTVIDMLDLPCVNAVCTEHDHAKEEVSDKEHHAYDEHVWLSLKNAGKICEYIYEALIKLDAKNKDLYRANYTGYVAKLTELDETYELAVADSKNNSVVFADRFPFVYMMEDYNLGYSAAFPGCSTETDASFQTIITLAERVDELNLKNVVVLENSTTEVAESVIENTEDKSAGIVTMNSMQSVTGEDIDNGAAYLKYMEENLEALVKALETVEE